MEVNSLTPDELARKWRENERERNEIKLVWVSKGSDGHNDDDDEIKSK